MSATTLTRREGRISLWRDCLRNRTFLAEVLFTIVLATVTLRICSFVLVRLELRPGAELDDPILRLVGPIRLTWFTFAVLWSSVFSSVYFMTRFPHVMVVGFQAAVLILFFRTVTIYLIPLRPLPTIIPLADPVVSYLGPGKLIIKDLLFSGHTSVMFLLFLAAQKTWLRVLYLTGTIIVASCVMLQHVHYSGDVFVAPFFAFASWRIANAFHTFLHGTPASASAA